MAEMIFRIPSKAVQYGYVEIPFTFDSAPDAEMLAAHYVNYVYAFQKAEQDAIKAIQMDVSAPVGYDHKVAEQQARELLNEGLGGVTELPEDDVHPVNQPSDEAPWDRPAVDGKPKPWESGSAAPATKPVIGEDW